MTSYSSISDSNKRNTSERKGLRTKIGGRMTMMMTIVIVLLLQSAVSFHSIWKQPPSKSGPFQRKQRGSTSLSGWLHKYPTISTTTLAAGQGFGKKSTTEGDASKHPKKAEASDKKQEGVLRMPSLSESQTSSTGGTAAAVANDAKRKFQMLYTCNICEGRNLITVDKVAFTEGIVIARCKHCDAKHLVADNLSKLDFKEGKVTLDDVLAMKGQEAKYVDLKSNPELASKYDLIQLEDGTVELAPKHRAVDKEAAVSEGQGGEAA